jgi:hypothetical protein
MSEAQTVRVTLVYLERYGGDWPPEDPAGFLAWWQDWIEQIPEEYRLRACIKIDSQGGYDGEHHACLEISYERPETGEKRLDRLHRARSEEMARGARDRAQYEALRRKFGGIG